MSPSSSFNGLLAIADLDIHPRTPTFSFSPMELPCFSSGFSSTSSGHDFVQHGRRNSLHLPAFQESFGFGREDDSDLGLQLLHDLKPPSLQDLDWLDSLTPVSTTPTDYASAEESSSWLDSVTPVSTPTPTSVDLHLWPSGVLTSVVTDIQQGVPESPISENPASTCSNITNNRKLLSPYSSPRALSPRNDAGTRKAEKRRKDSETNIPFNFKATTKDEAMYDGFRWKKYGKKSLKESPYPRYYFKCIDRHCTARKQVQHSPADPNVVLTTYEGVHNHDPPTSLPIGLIVSADGCVCPSMQGAFPCPNCVGVAGEAAVMPATSALLTRRQNMRSGQFEAQHQH